MRTRNPLTGWRLAGLPALILLGSCVTAGPAVAQPAVGVSMGIFDRTLSPYGDWVVVGRFGHVWRPYHSVVGVGFRPYLSGGHWVYTDYGWTFESDYEWGWATFHYGRWLLDDYYGWVWVPDTVWSPAWVDWRFGGGYVGWVPLAPAGFSVSYSFYRPAWCFVPVTHFVVRDVYHYALPVDRFHWAYAATSSVQQPVHYAGAQWNAGPPPGQVSQAIGHPIQPVSIAPPPPGRVQPVHVAPGGGMATHLNGAPASTPAAPPAGYAPHPPAAMAPGSSAPMPHSAPPPPGEARWGNAPVGGSPHWGRGAESSPQSLPGRPSPPPSPAPMNSVPPHSVPPSGASAPLPHSPSEAHWGQTPAAATPRWTGGSASAQPMPPPPPPAGNVHSGGFVPNAAPYPAPSSGRPSSGGFVPHAAPAPAPMGGHSVSPAPRAAPAAAPPPASGGSMPSPPPGKQGFNSPRMNPGAPQFRALSSSRADVSRAFGGFSRASAPIAYRAAPSPHAFAASRHR